MVPVGIPAYGSSPPPVWRLKSSASLPVHPVPAFPLGRVQRVFSAAFLARLLASYNRRVVYSPRFNSTAFVSCDDLEWKRQRLTRFLMLPCTVRRVVSVFLPALLLFASSGQPMSSQTPSRSPSKTVHREGWVDQTLQALSTEEKIGQLIMPAFRAVYLHSKSEEMREIERQIHENHVG